MLISHGSPNSCGTAILHKKPVVLGGGPLTSFARIKRPRWRPVGPYDRHLWSHVKIGDYEQSIVGLIISKVHVDDKVYVLINIYAPNEDKDSMLHTENLHSEENIQL